MAEDVAQKIADDAEVIVDGYAMLKHELGFQVVNLDNGDAALISPEGEILESSMDEVEEVIALKRFTENRQFMAA